MREGNIENYREDTSVTSEKLARQVENFIDYLTRQLERHYDLIQDLGQNRIWRNEDAINSGKGS